MSKIKDALEKVKDTARFLTESPDSEDFDKSRADWQASKDAKKADREK